jgi:hypothetical protein
MTMTTLTLVIKNLFNIDSLDQKDSQNVSNQGYSASKPENQEEDPQEEGENEPQEGEQGEGEGEQGEGEGEGDENERVPLLFVDVNLGAGRAERIVVYEGDKSDELAARFAEEHRKKSRSI